MLSSKFAECTTESLANRPPAFQISPRIVHRDSGNASLHPSFRTADKLDPPLHISTRSITVGHPWALAQHLLPAQPRLRGDLGNVLPPLVSAPVPLAGLPHRVACARRQLLEPPPALHHLGQVVAPRPHEVILQRHHACSAVLRFNAQAG